MPDITMCDSKTCKKRKKCYRHKAVPDSMGQSYFCGRMPHSIPCEHFWEVKPSLGRKS